jgi:hypothetical protein
MLISSCNNLDVKLIALIGLRLEVIGLDNYTITVWVNNWHNSEWDLSMREFSTTGATFKLASDSKKISVLNTLRIASWLHLGHHEEIFFTNILHNSLLLSLEWDFILNSFKINFKFSCSLVSSMSTLFLSIS